MKLASPGGTSKDCARTIERRTRIGRCDDANEEGRLQIRQKGSALCFRPAAVYNTFNVQRHLVRRQTHRQFRAEARAFRAPDGYGGLSRRTP